MVDVPADSADTTPREVIVATAVFEETHGLTAEGVPEPISCELLPKQEVKVPDIVGKPLMVTTAVAVHPLLLV